MKSLPKNERWNRLKKRLEEVHDDFDAAREIENDPVFFAKRYSDPRDQELAGFLSAAFAYGGVRQIQRTLWVVFEILGARPAQMIRANEPKRWQILVPSGFRHRFNDANDLRILLTWLGHILRANESLEAFFLKGLDEAAADIGPSLNNFSERILNLPCQPFQMPPTKGPRFFVSQPKDKSACKRMLLFLRWMVGTSQMDLALWKGVPKHLLLIPVDTHVLRISRHLGLTKRKDNSWRTSQEITNALKYLDSNDPTRFDFALCHLGISKECPSRFDLKICPKCRLNPFCQTFSRAK